MTPTERGQTFLGIWVVVMLVGLAQLSLAGTPTEAQIMGDGTWMRFGLTDLSRARVDALMARVRGVHGVVGIELPAISRLVKKEDRKSVV